MNRFSKIIIAAILTLCLLCGSIANVFGGGAVSLKADDSRQQQNGTYIDYYFGNLAPLGEYLLELGFDLDDEEDQAFLRENFLDYYNQAAEARIIMPCDNDILLAGDLSQGGSRWNSGLDYEYYVDGTTHQLLAAYAYDYASLFFPDLYIPGDNNSAPDDRSILVPYADYPDVKENNPVIPVIGGLNNYHFYTNGTNYFNNTLDPGMNAKTQFIAHYNDAIDYYLGGDKTESFKSLGKALHYISDLATPVHTGDRLSVAEAALGLTTIAGVLVGDPIALLVARLAGTALVESIVTRVLNHISFENYARDYAIDHPNDFNSISAPFASYSLGSLAETVTDYSSSFYGQVGGPFNLFVSNNDKEIVSAATLPYAADACASVLVKFAYDVGYRDVTVNGSYGNPTGAGSYSQGTKVNIYAGNAPSGYTFSNWTVNSGGISLNNANSASTYFTMPSNNVSVTANWKPNVTVNGGYNSQWTPSGAGSYLPGATVTINAGSSAGKIFNGWTVNSGGISLSPNSNSVIATFTMPNNPVTVTANWLNGYYVSVDSYASPNGTGSYLANATVTIHAGTRLGYTFDGWNVISGGASLANSGSQTTTFSMPAGNVSIEATWVMDEYGWGPYAESLLYPYFNGCEWCVPIEFQLSGNNYGDTYYGYAYFEYSWEADSFKMEAYNGLQYLEIWTDPNTNIQYDLYYGVYYDVQYCGNGPYYVTVNASYANTTGADYYYPEGTVNIYAGNRANYVFNGWTGNDAYLLANSSSATTYFTMPAYAVSFTANWEPVQVNYSVTVNGSKTSPTGAGNYAPGSKVNIYAGNAPSGYYFSGWYVNSGNVTLNSSSSASTYFTMPTGNVTVTANWAQITYSVSVSGSYDGYSGAGSYAQGSTVYIYAGSRPGYTFSGWTVNSGGVSLANSNSSTTSFTMPANAVSITANWTMINTWEAYGESLLYPYYDGCEYRVEYLLIGNGYWHYGYAYFEDWGDAYNFMMEAYYGTQYLDTWNGYYIEYQVNWYMEHSDDGENWYSCTPAPLP